MEFIIISGMSGAGKSSAAAFLEDLGFYCVDNMPVALITSFAGLCMAGAGTGKYSRVALVTDIRGGQTFDELFQALDGLREMHLDYQLLFIEAADEDIIRRYKETRHTHPLTRQGYALPEAVKMERMALEPGQPYPELVRAEPVQVPGGAAAAVWHGGAGRVDHRVGHVVWVQVRHPHRRRPGL